MTATHSHGAEVRLPLSLVCHCLRVALQQVPGSSTQEATEPWARRKSRAQAQLLTPRPAILRMGRACDQPRARARADTWPAPLPKQRHVLGWAGKEPAREAGAWGWSGVGGTEDWQGGRWGRSLGWRGRKGLFCPPAQPALSLQTCLWASKNILAGTSLSPRLDSHQGGSGSTSKAGWKGTGPQAGPQDTRLPRLSCSGYLGH